MQQVIPSKFEIAEYRDAFGRYYIIVPAGKATRLDIATNPGERIRTKCEARKALRQQEQVA